MSSPCLHIQWTPEAGPTGLIIWYVCANCGLRRPA